MFFLRHQKSILLLVLYGLMSGLGSAAYAQARYHLNKSG